LGINLEDLQPVEEKFIGTAADGGKLQVLGETKRPIRMQLGGHPTLVSIQPVVIRGLAMPVNISGPTMKKLKIDHLISQNKIRFQGRLIPLVSEQQKKTGWERTRFPLYLPRSLRIPAMTLIHFDIPVDQAPEKAEGFIVGNTGLLHRDNHHALPWKEVLVSVLPGRKVRVGLCNPTTEPMYMRKGMRYGDFCLTCDPRDLDANPYHLAAVSVAADGGKLTTRKKLDEIIEELKRKREDKTVMPEVKAPRPSTEKEKRAWLYDKFHFDDCDFLDTEELKEQAMMLLLDYWDVMSVDGEFGSTSLLQHEIHTPGARPIKCKMRPINPALRDSLKKQLNEWLSQGVIEPSQSPWSFPLVAAPKKNQQVRWCLDFRRLNDVTTKDAYAIPTIAENLDHLGKSKVFSSLDGAGAFHNVTVREEDRKKTAFSTPFGSFQFRKLPFGLTNGPATYCRLIDLALAGVPPSVALPYLDDILVHSPSVEQHFADLKRILDIHRKAGLKLQPAKCHIFRREAEYLGAVVSEKGQKPPPGYTELVRVWPVPKTRSQMRQFIGKTSYYRRFIKNFAHIAGPLHDVTGKSEDEKAPIEMTPAMWKAFLELRQALTKAPILAHPRFEPQDPPFILDTDFSYENRAIGGVLSQEQEGHERPIIFGGKKLSSSQMNYSATKGELVAFLYFCRQWSHYLLYKKFIFRTDHQPLKYIHSMLPTDAHTARILTTLADFRFDVKYRPGPSHGNADAMSRAPHLPQAKGELGIDPSGDDEDDDRYFKNSDNWYSIGAIRSAMDSVVSLIGLRDFDKADLVRLQEEDEDLGAVRRLKKESPKDADPAIVSALPPNARTYAQMWPHLEFDDDNILRFKSPSAADRALFCAPADLQQRLIEAAHVEGGHAAGASTALRLRESIFFPDLTAKVHDYVKTCLPCQQKNNKGKDQRHTLYAAIHGYPFQRVAIDFVGPLPTTRRNHKYILTARDAFTRWTEGVPVSACTARAAVRALNEHIFCRYGVPESLHSDQGTGFTAELFRDAAMELGIKHTVTPAYNPKSNPVERAHRDIGAALRAMIIENNAKQTSWEELLPPILYAMNTTVSSVTGYTPFKLMFGRDPNTPLHLIFGGPLQPAVDTLDDYVAGLQDHFAQAHKLARGNAEAAVERRRRHYNAEFKDFSVGQRVWLFSPVNPLGAARKLTTHWTGPWTITEKLSPLLYRIRGKDEWRISKLEQVVSVDRLKLYNPPVDIPDQPPTTQHDLASDADPFVERPFPIIQQPASVRQREIKQSVVDRAPTDDEDDEVLEPLAPADFGPDAAGPADELAPGGLEEPAAAAAPEPMDLDPAPAAEEEPARAPTPQEERMTWDSSFDFGAQDTRTPAQLRAAAAAGRRSMRPATPSTRSSFPASTPPSSAPSMPSPRRADTPSSSRGGMFARSTLTARTPPRRPSAAAADASDAARLGARPKAVPAASTAAKQLKFPKTAPPTRPAPKPQGPRVQPPLPRSRQTPPTMAYSPSASSPLQLPAQSPLRTRAQAAQEADDAALRQGAAAAEEAVREEQVRHGAEAARAAIRAEQRSLQPRQSARQQQRRQQQETEEEEDQRRRNRRRFGRDGDEDFEYTDWRKKKHK